MEITLFSQTIPLFSLLLIIGGGFFSGFVDAIAGGGGLISLPVFLATGLPVHLAIGTNKFAATFGSAASSWQFWRAGKVDKSLLKKAVPCTFTGAVLGSLSMLQMSAEFLQPLIIVALLAAAAFVFSRRSLGANNTYAGETRRVLLLTATFAALIGFYDGFVGPGTGTFLIVAFASLGFDFVTAAGNAKILNFTSNLTGFFLMIFFHNVLYVYAFAMAIAIFIGAWFGSHLAIRRGSAFVRVIMLLVTLALIGKLALQYAGLL